MNSRAKEAQIRRGIYSDMGNGEDVRTGFLEEIYLNSSLKGKRKMNLVEE